MENQKLLFNQQDIEQIVYFLNSLTVTGISAAKQITMVASILESGEKLEEYLEKR